MFTSKRTYTIFLLKICGEINLDGLGLLLLNSRQKSFVASYWKQHHKNMLAAANPEIIPVFVVFYCGAIA